VFGHEGPALEQGVRELTNGRGVDVILEMLANHNLGRDLPLLAMRGRVVVVGSRGSVEINPRDLMTRDAAVHGVSFFNLPPHDLRAAQEALGAAFELGHARPVVGEQFSLTDARRAHERLFESGARGKVVLTVAH
jgi:NADPH2:quinone reductase